MWAACRAAGAADEVYGARDFAPFRRALRGRSCCCSLPPSASLCLPCLNFLNPPSLVTFQTLCREKQRRTVGNSARSATWRPILTMAALVSQTVKISVMRITPSNNVKWKQSTRKGKCKISEVSSLWGIRRVDTDYRLDSALCTAVN